MALDAASIPGPTPERVSSNVSGFKSTPATNILQGQEVPHPRRKAETTACPMVPQLRRQEGPETANAHPRERVAAGAVRPLTLPHGRHNHACRPPAVVLVTE